MGKPKDEATTSVQTESRAPRRKRRRKKNYADDMYGARPAPEDARILDEYARLHGMDRTGVVRHALHKFALLQQTKFKQKDAFQEMQEQVFREHFAALFERLEALSATLQGLPEEVAGLNVPGTFRAARDGSEAGDTPFADDGENTDFLRRVESFLGEQRRTLEQVLLASTLALRLVVNYVVEPQLRPLEASDSGLLEPHLRAAEGGKAGWSAATGEVIRRTGKQVMRELNLAPPETKSGTADASRSEAKAAPASLSDAEIAATL